MFSLLNIYTLNIDEIISKNRFLNNIQNPQLFKIVRKMDKSGVPCISLKNINFDFKCMNAWFVLYNIAYFYNKSADQKKARKTEDIKRSILDYISYKGDIISDDFLTLNELTIYEHEYDYDDLFYLITYSGSYYENSIYLYFIKNYILLGGKELNENSGHHNEVVSLNTNSIIREIYDGFLQSIEKIEDVKNLENYRHHNMLKNFHQKDYLILINLILNFIKHYFKDLDIINVKYYKDLSDEDSMNNNENIITHDHSIRYFICINKETSDFLVNFNVSYTFYEVLDASYYHIPGSPFNMKMVFIKNKDYTKVKLIIIIDKNTSYFKDIQIYFNKDNIDATKHKYRENDVCGNYALVVFSRLLNKDISHIDDIVNYIKQMKIKIGQRKIYIM